MRWMWIDRIVELKPRERLVAIKNISLAEEHLHDHFEAEGDLSPMPIMPASLILEGMAQTAGILVGHAGAFKEKVILAKIGRAELTADAVPGDQLRYTADVEQLTPQGAATKGVIDRFSPDADRSAEPERIGEVTIVFSHIDQNMAGVQFPEHNFVFGDAFRTLLTTSGVAIPTE